MLNLEKYQNLTSRVDILESCDKVNPMIELHPLFDALAITVSYIMIMFHTLFELYLVDHYDFGNGSQMYIIFNVIFWPIKMLKDWYDILVGKRSFL